MKMNCFTYFILLSFVLMACQSNEPSREESLLDPVKAGKREIHLRPGQLERANIRVMPVQKQWMGEKIRVNGLFDVPPQNRAQVSSMVEAFVQNTSLLVGDKVKKGQTLATLTHPDLITLQNDLVEKNQQLRYLESEYQRQLELDKSRINAKKNLVKAETGFKGMLAQVNALKEKIKMLGIDPRKVLSGKIFNQIELRSPLNGYLTHVHASIGAMVTPGQPVFEIVDLDHMHVELKIFEKDIHKIKVNEPFTFRITGDSIDYPGSIHLVGKQLGEDRTIDVHGHTQEKRPYFLPGMYVEASIYTHMDSVQALPETAFFEREGGLFVFIRKNDSSYQIKEVTTGKQTDAWIELKNNDLPAEAEVVVEGVYYLSSLIGGGV